MRLWSFWLTMLMYNRVLHIRIHMHTMQRKVFSLHKYKILYLLSLLILKRPMERHLLPRPLPNRLLRLLHLFNQPRTESHPKLNRPQPVRLSPVRLKPAKLLPELRQFRPNPNEVKRVLFSAPKLLVINHNPCTHVQHQLLG